MSHHPDNLQTIERFSPIGQPPSLRKIAVLTSGGDAPGMNAALRGVVRTSLLHQLQVVGIHRGYLGLLQSEFSELKAGDTGNILQKGGTVLKTARVPEMTKPETRALAAKIAKQNGFDAIVCIGGDGTFTGAHLLWTEHGIPVVGIPATIDNDIAGTEATIGFDTALNTALDAIDRIRDTADSHERLFIVEVMGRDSGFIAVETALAAGAEEAFFAESHATVETTIQKIENGIRRGKKSSILITAEGKKPGRAYLLAEQIRKKTGWEAKVCILGHIQRGGAPSAFDRNLASRMGASAVEVLKRGHCDCMIGFVRGRIEPIALKNVIGQHKHVPEDWLRLLRSLAT